MTVPHRTEALAAPSLTAAVGRDAVHAATGVTSDRSHLPIVGLCPDCTKEHHHAHP